MDPSVSADTWDVSAQISAGQFVDTDVSDDGGTTGSAIDDGTGTGTADDEFLAQD
ncbi:MAG: hypothetical protein GWO22_26215, partial [Actinobacteria bacterium]|nr:hypothetical protein [Actinomycetota bacterium]